MKSPSEVRALAHRLHQRSQEPREDLKWVEDQQKALQKECPHPTLGFHSQRGAGTRKWCPDCGFHGERISDKELS